MSWSPDFLASVGTTPAKRAPKMYTCPACGHQSPHRARLPLTRRQRDIVAFIGEFEKAEHIFPSFSEIQKQFGFRSPATVHEHIQALVRKGWLVRVGGWQTARPYATREAGWGA